MKLYIGNLPFSATDADLREVFGAHGTVTDAIVMMDRTTGRSRGFGFVTMGTPDEGRAAITALSGADMGGRNSANPSFAICGSPTLFPTLVPSCTPWPRLGS
jgi:RNA recognition motif-containing protein